MIDKIIFPVLTFSRPNVIEFAKDIDRLTSCNRLGLKNGYYNNLSIVDSIGNSFVVAHAHKIGTIGPFWGFNIFLEQSLRVELEFEKGVEQLGLDDFKDKVLNVFEKDKYFWDSGGNLDELKRAVRSAKTHGELIEKLGDYIG